MDTCAGRHVLVVVASVDLVSTLGAEDMGCSLRWSRMGYSAATVKETFVESRERDGMLSVIKGSV